eukprot:CAMPEP_0181484874 /NCGR_PEP_ID=MMETSP1110-20121109/46242_1 /TAXON_ID=174948 /ORGANISM="Symbiodinium sp., Strain CCMP421" /LENGTH=92 /DNA_ID=CAMNT_0023610791 /DNA_START=683 /DNA_END=958 /DNA_ORIENTATION=+
MTMNCGQLGGTQARPPVHPAANPPANTLEYKSNTAPSGLWLANVKAFRRGVKKKMPNGPPTAPARTRGVSGNLTDALRRQQRPNQLREDREG